MRSRFVEISLLIGLIFIANLVFAQPSLADKPKFLKNPDYIEVTKALNSLKTAKDTQAQVEGYTPEELQQKIDELEFQKYALETGVNWGQCRNETGKTLAVYGPAPDFTAAIEFSIPPTQVLKANEANWFIPNVSQAVIEARVPNAPTAKISKANQLVVMGPEKDTAKANIAPETQPQSEPQAQSQQTSQKSSYFKKI